MKIVLKENMSNLGEKGEIVEVKDGYARNYLIPNGLALPYNKKTKKMVENLLELQENKIQREESVYQEKLDAVKGKNIVVEQKTGEQGRLFGTVTTQDIEDALKKQEDVEIDRKYIVLEKQISTVGEYDVKVKFAQGFVANFSLVVESEEDEEEKENEKSEEKVKTEDKGEKEEQEEIEEKANGKSEEKVKTEDKGEKEEQEEIEEKANEKSEEKVKTEDKGEKEEQEEIEEKANKEEEAVEKNKEEKKDDKPQKKVETDEKKSEKKDEEKEQDQEKE